MKKDKISDFLNHDIAYLLGIITAKGEIQENRDIRRIIINFKYKSLEAKGINISFNQRLHIQTSLDNVVARLQRLGIDTSKNISSNLLTIVLKWPNEDISWKFIKYLINGTHYSYHSFDVPCPIFHSNDELKREYIRGFADVTGFVRASNNDQIGRHRVYLEIDFKNWYLPVQLCKVIQSLNVPIQNINYAHPNFRDPKNIRSSSFWKKEHQIKIYAEDFMNIGFYISHKQRALEELSDYNTQNFQKKQSLCNGTTTRMRVKPTNPNEKSPDLPKNIKGKHFDNYRELCRLLGCYMQQ